MHVVASTPSRLIFITVQRLQHSTIVHPNCYGNKSRENTAHVVAGGANRGKGEWEGGEGENEGKGRNGGEEEPNLQVPFLFFYFF